MTFCATWAHSDRVFMVADSLVSFRGAQVAHTTSTGQVFQPCTSARTDHCFLEYCAKVRPVSDNVAVTGCGRGDIILSFGDHLQSILRGSLPIEEAIPCAAAKVRPMLTSSENDDTAIHIGVQCSSGPRVFRYQLPAGYLQEGNSFTDSGLTGAVRGLFDGVVAKLPEWSIPLHLHLPSATASLLSLTLRNNTAADGVGGSFFGGSIGEDGFVWLQHCVYLLGGPESWIACGDQDDAIAPPPAPEELGFIQVGTEGAGCAIFDSNLRRGSLVIKLRNDVGPHGAEFLQMRGSRLDPRRARFIFLIDKVSPLVLLLDGANEQHSKLAAFTDHRGDVVLRMISPMLHAMNRAFSCARKQAGQAVPVLAMPGLVGAGMVPGLGEIDSLLQHYQQVEMVAISLMPLGEFAWDDGL